MGKQYLWVVDAANDGAGGELLARLTAVIEGCVVCEPSRRLTVPRVLETLTALQREAVVASGRSSGGGIAGGGGSRGEMSPVGTRSPAAAVTPGSLMYDVVAIVAAMESLSIDASGVIDALGGVTASSLDALKAVGVPIVKCVAVKRALSTMAATVPTPVVPAQVSQ